LNCSSMYRRGEKRISRREITGNVDQNDWCVILPPFFFVGFWDFLLLSPNIPLRYSNTKRKQNTITSGKEKEIQFVWLIINK
jgi:hypothetical protein